MMISGKFLTITLIFSVGYGIEIGIVETIDDILTNFNTPLKLTLMACWDAETTVRFVRYTNEFQLKIMNESSELTPNIFERHQEVIITDLNCDYASNILSKISRHMFNFYKIIVFDSSVIESNNVIGMDLKIQQLFHDSPILPMSQIFFICRDFKQKNFLVKQVYRMGLNEPLVVEEYALYNGTQYVRVTSLTSALRRNNLHGLDLRASMVILNNATLNHLDDYRDIHIDGLSKLCYQLTKHLIAFVNGTVKFSVVPTWGYKNKTTGEYNGMIGQLIRDEADIGATSLIVTTDRIPSIEYIAHSITTDSAFIFLSPKLSYTDNIYSLPFEGSLWMCSLLLVLVMGICMVIAAIFELKTLSHSENQCSVSDVFIIIFGAVCQQGSAVTPNSVTGRMIMAIVFTSLMFFFVSYCANIVALLQSPSNRIDTLEELYNTKLDFSILDIVYNRYFFAAETEPFRKKFYDDKLVGKFIEAEEGIKKVREGQHAFFSEFTTAYKVISETFNDIEKCGLKEITFFQMKLTPWYAIQKNSSYKEILKVGLMRIHEHGLKQRESLRYFLKKPKCSGGGGSFVPVDLIDVRPAIAIFLGGIGITVAIFISELLVKHFNFIRKSLKTKLKM